MFWSAWSCNSIGRCGSAAKRSPHRPGIPRTLGLRARSDGRFIVTRTERPSIRKELIMSVATLSRRRRRGRPARSIRASLQVELLESRCLLSNLNLTPLVPVSGPSPFLGNPIEANDPAVTINSEVEPYVAVDPTNSKHFVGFRTSPAVLSRRPASMAATPGSRS